jgi:hypothetical protein
LHIKETIIKISALLPILLFYLYPMDTSVTGKGVLLPSKSANLTAPISGPLHIDFNDAGKQFKSGEKLFEVVYSDQREQLLMGLRSSRIRHVNDELDQLKRTRSVLKHIHNPSFKEELEEIKWDLKRHQKLKEELSAPQTLIEETDKSLNLLAPSDGIVIRSVNEPKEGEYVNEGRLLGRFVQGNDLRIVVLYPYEVLPEIQSNLSDVDLKIPSPSGQFQTLIGKPLTAPLMGIELWSYLQDTNSYLLLVRTKENKKILEQSFGVLYEVKNGLTDCRTLIYQEVDAKIKKPRVPLIMLLLDFSKLNWNVFVKQFFKEPLVGLQCFLSAFNFWITLPFLPLTIFFAGMVPSELRKRYLQSLRACVPEKPLRISAVVPFYNEEEVITTTIESIARQTYPLEKIFLVDDGSTDNYFELLNQKFKLEKVDIASIPVNSFELTVVGKKRDIHLFKYLDKEFVLIRKENAGKGYALNSGINRVESDYVVTVDGDTVLDPDSILKLVWPIYEDLKIKVVHGRLGVMNNCVVKNGVVVEKRLPRGFIELCQSVEYFGFGIYKAFQNVLGIQTVIIGAFACFEIKTLREVGGFHNRTIVEDQDIAYEIHKKTAERSKDFRNIIYVPSAVAWTQVPFNWKNLYRQRLRWAGGSVDTLMKHSEMIFKPKYRWLSLFAMPLAWFNYVIFWLTLPLNAFGIVGLGINLYLYATSDVWRWVVHYFTIYFLVPNLLYMFYMNLYDYVYLDESYIKSWGKRQKIFLFIFARIGYFAFGYILSYFNFIGHMKAIFGKLSWDKIERKAVKNQS